MDIGKDLQDAYERGRQDAWDIAQKVFDSTVTLYEAEDVAKQIAKTEQTEPQTERLEQFRVGLEYHTDTTHFGKVKGESITTNKVEDEPQIVDWKDQMWTEAVEASKDEPQQIASKLTDAEISTVSAVESTMGQPKSKLKDKPQTDCAWKQEE